MNLVIAIQAVGKSDRGYLNQVRYEDIQAQLACNLIPTLQFSKICYEPLVRSKGTMVHIGSLAGIVAAPGMGGYSVSKHAVVAASRQMRNEWLPSGVRVMLVCPGPIGDLMQGLAIPTWFRLETCLAN